MISIFADMESYWLAPSLPAGGRVADTKLRILILFKKLYKYVSRPVSLSKVLNEAKQEALSSNLDKNQVLVSLCFKSIRNIFVGSARFGG